MAPPTTPERNCADLPRDVTLTILMKLGPLEILESAQFVCSSWYNLCKDPSMWRHIKMENVDSPELATRHENMLFTAVTRSAGALIALDVEGFGSDDLISFVASRSSELKSLRLACCYSMSADALIKALDDLPALEELELTLCSFSQEKVLTIIRCCPFLKTFKLNEKMPSLARYTDDAYDDEEALAIAKSMPELHHLQLMGNCMTNEGLKAILDSCHHLQSLDMRACFHVDLDGDLGQRCSKQIKNLWWPLDPTDDCYFHSTDFDSDFDIEDVDGEFISDDEQDNGFSDDEEMLEFVLW